MPDFTSNDSSHQESSSSHELTTPFMQESRQTAASPEASKIVRLKQLHCPKRKGIIPLGDANQSNLIHSLKESLICVRW